MPQRPLPTPPPIPPDARRPRRAVAVLSEGPRVPVATEVMVPPPVPPEARRVRSPAALASAPDADLVTASRDGDRRAFAELVRRYRPRIMALALQMTASRADSDDITQEVFLQALEGLPGFGGRCAFYTWLYRIALNTILEARSSRQRRVVDLDDPRVSLAVAVDASHNPAHATELRETYIQLVRAFDTLSPLLRSTVALITLQGLSLAAAAEVMGTTEGTVAWRMHEARDQLRRTLQPSGVTAGVSVVIPSRQRVVEHDTPGASLALALTLACV